MLKNSLNIYEPQCVKCTEAKWDKEGSWGICKKAPKEKNCICKTLPGVNCPMESK